MNPKLIALAVGLCAAGSVSAQTLSINAGGASATRATITNAVIESICGTTGITWFQNGTNVTRITCPMAAGTIPGFTALDFSYDNTTGSFLGVGPVSGVGTVARVNIGAGTTCSAGTNATVAGKTVLNRTGCGNEATGVRPSVGNADVEPDLFIGVLAPTGVSFNPNGIQTVSGQFGVIFGIVTSLPLYRALQADQGLTADDAEANAPSLSSAQVASISTNNAGPLNTDWTPLFRNTPPAAASQPVRFVRRVAGSGSHATFSAVNLNVNCSARATAAGNASESVPTWTVLEYGATGNQLVAVDSIANFPIVNAANASANAVALSGTAKPANYYAMGYASRENAPGTAGWRFVKLDGQYPSKANAQNGRYNWVAEQVLTLRTGATASEEAFFNKLAQVTGSPTVISNFTAAVRDGTVALPFVADAADPNYIAQRTRFRTLANSCVRPFAVE
jgi:hypothetical protein